MIVAALLAMVLALFQRLRVDMVLFFLRNCAVLCRREDDNRIVSFRGSGLYILLRTYSMYIHSMYLCMYVCRQEIPLIRIGPGLSLWLISALLCSALLSIHSIPQRHSSTLVVNPFESVQ
jgi:hypothetical protein